MPSFKNDRWIVEQAQLGMISPFEESSVRTVNTPNQGSVPALSYGTSSYGYDIRLSPKEFLIFQHVPGTVVNPKAFDPGNLKPVDLNRDEYGDYFIIPANSYGLGVSLEKIQMPANVTAICLGKSTYARVGLIANATPLEACMADDTEVLAESGWKLLKDVIIGEKVLTLNPETNQSELQPVQDRQVYYFNGELLHFYGKFIDQLVTPQHRMWTGKKKRCVAGIGVDGRSSKQKVIRRDPEHFWDWQFMSAESLFGQWNYHLSRDVDWEGVAPISETFDIGKYSIPIETWCKFIGAWMGDGSAYDGGNGNYVIKLAVVTKKTKRTYFREILTQMKVNFHESRWGFSFQDKALCQYLMPYKGAKNKHLPKEIKSLPPSLLLFVIEGMMASDGNLASSTYCSASKQLIGDFHEICLKAGYNASCWEETEYSQFAKTTSTQYKCRYSARNSTPNKMVPGQNMSKVPYAGMVYDITVPNHIFLSRRNGRASWTGNSWRGAITLEFSNASSADCRIYANEGVVQLLFFEGDACKTTYGDRHGKYQDQEGIVTLPRI